MEDGFQGDGAEGGEADDGGFREGEGRGAGGVDLAGHAGLEFFGGEGEGVGEAVVAAEAGGFEAVVAGFELALPGGGAEDAENGFFGVVVLEVADHAVGELDGGFGRAGKGKSPDIRGAGGVAAGGFAPGGLGLGVFDEVVGAVAFGGDGRKDAGEAGDDADVDGFGGDEEAVAAWGEVALEGGEGAGDGEGPTVGVVQAGVEGAALAQEFQAVAAGFGDDEGGGESGAAGDEGPGGAAGDELCAGLHGGLGDLEAEVAVGFLGSDADAVAAGAEPALEEGVLADAVGLGGVEGGDEGGADGGGGAEAAGGFDAVEAAFGDGEVEGAAVVSAQVEELGGGGAEGEAGSGRGRGGDGGAGGGGAGPGEDDGAGFFGGGEEDGEGAVGFGALRWGEGAGGGVGDEEGAAGGEADGDL